MIRTRWALATLLAASLVGACSDDDPEPDIADPTASASSSSATVSPSPTVPATPALGPEDTVRAWVDAENQALATGSTDALRGLAASECAGCDDFPRPIEQVYGAGGSFQGGAWKLVSTHIEDSSSDTAQVTAAVRIAAGTTVPEAGADPVNYEPQKHLLSFDLVTEGGNWRFSAISFVS